MHGRSDARAAADAGYGYRSLRGSGLRSQLERRRRASRTAALTRTSPTSAREREQPANHRPEVQRHGTRDRQPRPALLEKTLSQREDTTRHLRSGRELSADKG